MSLEQEAARRPHFRSCTAAFPKTTPVLDTHQGLHTQHLIGEIYSKMPNICNCLICRKSCPLRYQGGHCFLIVKSVQLELPYIAFLPTLSKIIMLISLLFNNIKKTKQDIRVLDIRGEILREDPVSFTAFLICELMRDFSHGHTPESPTGIELSWNQELNMKQMHESCIKCTCISPVLTGDVQNRSR